jgi:hypothetical protein
MVVIDSLQFELHGVVTQPVRSMIRKNHTPSPKNHGTRSCSTSREKRIHDDDDNHSKVSSTSKLTSSTMLVTYDEIPGTDDNLIDSILVDPSPSTQERQRQQNYNQHQQVSSFDRNVGVVLF